jgi:hypothetical protein
MPSNRQSGRFRGTLLVSDVRTTFMLVDHARQRAIHRVFGLPPEQDNVLTLPALGPMAGAAHNGYRRAVDAPGLPLGGDDFLLGTASLSELISGVAGRASRKTPMLGTLLLAVVAAGAARPVLRRTLGAVSKGQHGVSFRAQSHPAALAEPGAAARQGA